MNICYETVQSSQQMLFIVYSLPIFPSWVVWSPAPICLNSASAWKGLWVVNIQHTESLTEPACTRKLNQIPDTEVGSDENRNTRGVFTAAVCPWARSTQNCPIPACQKSQKFTVRKNYNGKKKWKPLKMVANQEIQISSWTGAFLASVLQETVGVLNNPWICNWRSGWQEGWGTVALSSPGLLSTADSQINALATWSLSPTM